MKALKIWSLLGSGALVAAAVTLGGIVLIRGDRREDRAAGQAAHDTEQNGQIVALKTWQEQHDARTQPLIERFERLDRRFDALFLWLRLVARQEGWPEPPMPAGCTEEGCDEQPEGILAATSP